MKIRVAESADWTLARELLLAAGLPTQDLGPDSLQGFLVAEQPIHGALHGLVGLQHLSHDIGLIRSLVVATAARGSGLGSQMLACAEAAAMNAGLCELWLLTIDADEYFHNHGYTRVVRTDTPDAVRQTAEFSSLCPGDAVVMRKILRSNNAAVP